MVPLFASSDFPLKSSEILHACLVTRATLVTCPATRRLRTQLNNSPSMEAIDDLGGGAILFADGRTKIASDLVGNVVDMSARHVGVVSCRLISSRHPNVADIVTGVVGESR